MSGSDNSSGLMSSAGLVRYFDSESANSITIDRKTIVASALLFGIIIEFAHLVM